MIGTFLNAIGMTLGHRYTYIRAHTNIYIYRGLSTVEVEVQNMTEGSHTLLRFHLADD